MRFIKTIFASTLVIASVFLVAKLSPVYAQTCGTSQLDVGADANGNPTYIYTLGQCDINGNLMDGNYKIQFTTPNGVVNSTPAQLLTDPTGSISFDLTQIVSSANGDWNFTPVRDDGTNVTTFETTSYAIGSNSNTNTNNSGSNNNTNTQPQFSCFQVCNSQTECQLFCPSECSNIVRDPSQGDNFICGPNCGGQNQVCCPSSVQPHLCKQGFNCVHVNAIGDDLSVTGQISSCDEACGGVGQPCCTDADNTCNDPANNFCNSDSKCEAYPADECVFGTDTKTEKTATGYNVCVDLQLLNLNPNKQYLLYTNAWGNPFQDKFAGTPTYTSNFGGGLPAEHKFCATFDPGLRNSSKYTLWLAPSGDSSNDICRMGLNFDPNMQTGDTKGGFYVDNDGISEPCRVKGDQVLEGDYIATAIGCVPIDPQEIAKALAGFGIGVAGGIALILLAIASLMVMTSQGDPKRLNSGKELFFSALMGLLLIILSGVVLKIMGVSILGLF